MYKSIVLILIGLISPISFADNLATQEQIELQDSLSSNVNTAVDNDQYPASSSNTNTNNMIGNGLDSSNSKVDNVMGGLNSEEQNTKLQENQSELQELNETSSKNNAPVLFSGSNSKTIQQALVINQENQLTKIHDSQNALNTQQTSEIQENNKQSSSNNLKLSTELNLADVALNYCIKDTKDCLKYLQKRKTKRTKPNNA